MGLHNISVEQTTTASVLMTGMSSSLVLLSVLLLLVLSLLRLSFSWLTVETTSLLMISSSLVMVLMLFSKTDRKVDPSY